MNLEEVRKLVAKGREVRVFDSVPAEIRADDETGEPGWTLAGHAAVFDQETIIWGLFREKIAPGAFDDVLEDDVRHLINHDPNLVMARTKSGTLRIGQDADGLAFEADLNPDDPDAVAARAKVLRGDVDQSSFAFTVAEDKWEDGETDEESGTRTLPLRTITKMKRLYDTSTVTYPAYPGADSGVRAEALELLEGLENISDTTRARLASAISEAAGNPALLLSALNEFERAIREGSDDEPAADEPQPEPAEAGDEGGEPDEGAATPEGDEPEGETPAEPEGAGEEAPTEDAEPEPDEEGKEEDDLERSHAEALQRRFERTRARIETQ